MLDLITAAVTGSLFFLLVVACAALVRISSKAEAMRRELMSQLERQRQSRASLAARLAATKVKLNALEASLERPAELARTQDAERTRRISAAGLFARKVADVSLPHLVQVRTRGRSEGESHFSA